MNRWAPNQQSGFTIVELLIVIVVIGILAAIVLVTYNGVQTRARETAIKSDLANAAKAMDIAKAFDGQYPSTLPPDVKSSPGVTLSLVVSTLPYYSRITAVQNGVLLSQICQDLVNEGKGRGVNLGGGTDAYITGCGNWNADSMQVTGWSSQVFSTPIAAGAFSAYVASVPSGDAWHPNQQSVIRNFYTEMQTRLLAQGGSFPITSFWDSWASPGNGILRQELPTPEIGGNSNSFCVQATATSGVWNIRPSGIPTKGNC